MPTGFALVPSALQNLIDTCERTLAHEIEHEIGVALDKIANFPQVVQDVQRRLEVSVEVTSDAHCSHRSFAMTRFGLNSRSSTIWMWPPCTPTSFSPIACNHRPLSTNKCALHVTIIDRRQRVSVKWNGCGAVKLVCAAYSMSIICTHYTCSAGVARRICTHSATARE
jgi:hypothetical protein